MHNRIGGGGFMSDPNVAGTYIKFLQPLSVVDDRIAGFDPIFWLHHANVGFPFERFG
jgi:hypothetical protein